MYSINTATGVLTPLTPATVSTGSSPFDVTVDPSGKFAYVPNAYDPNNTVSQYAIDSVTGVLTPNTPSAVATGNQPTSVTVDPSGKFAYVVNRLDNTVSMFTINATNGTLTLVATVATGSQPFRMAIDPSGHFAYVANENGASVSIYTLKSDGTLTPAGAAATQGDALSVLLSGTIQ
jgi:6-phosphogluconolactonase